jgi:drug/metabolite transporter (DMT)-like permease
VTLLELMAGVAFAVTASTIGDLLLARGMRRVGEVRWTGFRGALATLRSVVSTPEIPAAIGFLAIFFFTWLSLLSRADLSLILPMTALTYILNGLAARPVLGETVSRQRWFGIWVITVGVVLVTISGEGH